MQFKNFYKTMLFQILSFGMIIGGFVVYAVSFPIETPIGEVDGGEFSDILRISEFTQTGIIINTGSEKSLSDGLSLDVQGNVGAIEYCDENGENCFTSSDALYVLNGGCDPDQILVTFPTGEELCLPEDLNATVYGYQAGRHNWIGYAKLVDGIMYVRGVYYCSRSGRPGLDTGWVEGFSASAGSIATCGDPNVGVGVRALFEGLSVSGDGPPLKPRY